MKKITLIVYLLLLTFFGNSSFSQCAPTNGTTTFDGLYTATTNLGDGDGTTSASASNILCWDFEINMAANSSLLRIRGFNNLGDGDTTDDDVVAFQNSNQAINYHSIKSNDNSEFKLNSFKILLIATATPTHDFTVQGYKDGVMVSGASESKTALASTTWHSVDVSSNANFSNVDEIRITNFSTSNGNFPAQVRYDDIETSGATLGFEENLLKDSISVYPNPVENILHVRTNSATIEEITLYDILGKAVNNIYVNNETVDVSNMRSGVYLLKVKTTEGVINQKIIKE